MLRIFEIVRGECCAQLRELDQVSMSESWIPRTELCLATVPAISWHYDRLSSCYSFQYLILLSNFSSSALSSSTATNITITSPEVQITHSNHGHHTRYSGLPAVRLWSSRPRHTRLWAPHCTTSSRKCHRLPPKAASHSLTLHSQHRHQQRQHVWPRAQRFVSKYVVDSLAVTS